MSNQLAFLSKELERALKENRMLKAALTRQTIEAGKTFQEMRGQFDELATQIYDVIVHWVKRLERPVTYDEVIRYYKLKNPSAKYTSETITRRVRELKEDGWLHSPTLGTFVPVAREAK